MSRVLVFGVAICVLITAGLVPASQPVAARQATGATINGTTADPSGGVLPGVTITLQQGTRTVSTKTSDAQGRFQFTGVQVGAYRVRAELAGFKTSLRDVTIRSQTDVIALPIRLELGALTETITVMAGSSVVNVTRSGTSATAMDQFSQIEVIPQRRRDNESYLRFPTNDFRVTAEDPLSTFGADVDTASFTNVRRFLSAGRMPPRDAVRVEELLNYFRFQYPEASGTHPIAVTTEVGECPWKPAHKLVLIGARARSASDKREVGGRNIVLLLDVSGSMEPRERLPLIKTALGMWVETLRPDDRVAIVTYAGTSGVALPSTVVRQRERIQDAIDSLAAGGSTNGGDGLRLAYRIARENFVRGGVNRVILATDGDFNVGVVDQSDLVRLIEDEKRTGVFLSVLGVGSGNLKDSTMELLADRGNGHYAYLDSLQEARRVLIREGEATLETVAKDVKFQVEFNPATVAAWKLIGYENRALAAEDFNNDRKDGGEMGAGHSVTVLYEIVPAGADRPDDRGDTRPAVDPLKYQQSPTPPPRSKPAVPADAGELLTVKVRYQPPDGTTSRLLEQAVRAGGTARHLPFASAVAEFGMLLRAGETERSRWQALERRTRSASAFTSRESDRETLRELVEIAAGLRRGRN